MSETEQTAIANLLKGEVRGLETLVRIYQLRSIRAAYVILGDRQAAEDVVADAFIRVYERIAQYDPLKSFAPWFYRIVVNEAFKVARKANRSDSLDEDPTFLDSLLDKAAGPEDEVLLTEMRYLMLSAIYTLPAKQRAALMMRYYLDMQEKEIATALGWPLGTVKWRLHAAKKKLRESLVPRFGRSALDYDW